MSFVDGSSQSAEPKGTEGQSDPFDGLSDYGKSYLQNVPEDQRAVVAQHLRGWDSGFTRRMQEVHEQYRPYRDLGDPQTASRAVAFARRFELDPAGTIRLLVENNLVSKEDLAQLVGIQSQGQMQNQQPQAGDEIDPRIQKLLDERLSEQQKAIGAMATLLQQQLTEKQKSEQDRALQTEVDRLRGKYGQSFNEDLTLAMAAQTGVELERAHEIVQQQIQAALNARQAPRAPLTMGGSGAPPNFGKDVTAASPDEIKQYVASFLAQNNGR